jgi:hypothetical protein
LNALENLFGLGNDLLDQVIDLGQVIDPLGGFPGGQQGLFLIAWYI